MRCGGGAVQRQCNAEFCHSTTHGAMHVSARQNINTFHVPDFYHYPTTPDSCWWCDAEFGNSSTLRVVHGTATQSTGIFYFPNFCLHPNNSHRITSLSSLLFVCWLLFYCPLLGFRNSCIYPSFHSYMHTITQNLKMYQNC